MPIKSQQVPLTQAEATELKRLVDEARGIRLSRTVLQLVVVLWLGYLLAGIVVWQLVAMVVRVASGMAIGWSSPYGNHILWSLVAFSGVLVALRWWHSNKGSQARVTDLRSEFEAGMGLQEEYEFFAAKRFQEMEYGGLIYFLRSSTGKAYVLYDRESQDLGCSGKDPLTSSFVPRTRMRVTLTPRSRCVLSREFSGDALELPVPVGMVAEDWPEGDEYCPVAWDELEKHYGGSKN